ncbi:MAG: hypothetical protein F6K11_12850 [Leptolyngbya sp. SIO3F4]|nr:hypothetical protein [Leptolyngbya sp. SIO3F4]
MASIKIHSYNGIGNLGIAYETSSPILLVGMLFCCINHLSMVEASMGVL